MRFGFLGLAGRAGLGGWAGWLHGEVSEEGSVLGGRYGVVSVQGGRTNLAIRWVVAFDRRS